MATSAWGKSWGLSFGRAWGTVEPDVVPVKVPADRFDYRAALLVKGIYTAHIPICRMGQRIAKKSRW